MKSVKEGLLRLAEIGREPDGGISRIFGSPAMQEGIIRTEEYFRECGMSVYTDSVGNVHGILSCGKKNAREILVGSHLDTVKEGGMFDGLLGIVAGAECARSFKEEHFPMTRDLHIIATNGEEGNELGGTFGSRAMMGLLPLSSAEYIKKAESYGYSLKAMKNALLDTTRTCGYLELHIEQGPTLEIKGEKTGIVTGIVGLRRYQVKVYGKSNHAGTTMMEDRDDALVSAARILLMGDELARETGHYFVETVGILKVYPGSAPVIPNCVEMTLEIRNESEKRMDAFMQEYLRRAENIARVSVERLVQKAPVKCSERLIRVIETACRAQGISSMKMPSGATHDGNAMAVRMPVGMLFVPSVGGISHAKEEWTSWEDADRGAQVLLETLKQLQREEMWSC